MNKLIYIIFVLVISLTAVSALQITPVISSITVNISETSSLPILFTNNFNYTIYNVTMQTNNPNIAFVPIPTLSPGENFTRSATITTLQPYNTQTTLSFYFFYLTNQTVASTVVNSNFTQDVFSPNQIIISKSSTVIWKNIDQSLGMPIYINGANICSFVTINATCSYVFNDIGSFTISKGINGQQSVIVNSNIQSLPTRNPDYDVSTNINIISRYKPSDVTMTTFASNYSILWNGNSDGALQFVNIGSQTIHNVSIQCSQQDWCSFAVNNFDLTAGQQKYVVYTISPKIFSSANTNKTYPITITMTSANTNNVTNLISVYVPYQNLEFTQNGSFSPEWYLEVERLRKEFCDAHPDSVPTCRTEPVIIYTNSTNSTSSNFNVTYSQKDVYELKTSLLNLQTIVTENSKYMNQITSTVNQTSSQNVNYQNQTANDIQSVRESVASVKSLIWVEVTIGLFLFLVFVSGMVYKLFIRKSSTDMELGA